MDPDKQTLRRGDAHVPVPPKAFETLLALVRRSREVVSKEELLKEVWPNSFVEESNLSQNIFLLRKALGDTAENRQYIVTLPGRGYRFAATVRTVTEQGEALVAQARTRTQIVIEENGAETEQALKALPIPRNPTSGPETAAPHGGRGGAAWRSAPSFSFETGGLQLRERRTSSWLLTSPIQPAIRYLTTRCARDSRSNWNRRRFSICVRGSNPERPCG